MSSMATPAGRAHLFSRKPVPTDINISRGTKSTVDPSRYYRDQDLKSGHRSGATALPEVATLLSPVATTLREQTLRTTKNSKQHDQLPIYQLRAQLLRAIDLSDVVVITAETGAGKSTQVPQMLLDAGYTVTMTQPRRLAASSVATRIAQERKQELGDEVGYRHALHEAVSSQSKLIVSTDGYELRKALHGSTASQSDVLIIDEFHERNQSMDALLALHEKRLNAYRLGKGERPPKLVIMSATIDADALSERFGAPVLTASGRAFPIEQQTAGRSIASDAAELAKQGKNVLVFLPGKPEIRDLHEQLEELGVDAQVLPLHSQLTAEEQAKVFKKFDQAKIILATNIAETSITIPDIDAVIDSGLEKDVSLRDGVETLSPYPISKFNVLQRMGRCGRCGPGIYIYHGFKPIEELDEMPSPEIERVALERLFLILAAGGESLERLPFLNRPPQEHIEIARKALYQLNLIGPTDFPTAEGKRVAALPVNVRTGKMLARAEQLDPKYPGLLENVIDIAAIIEAEGILIPESKRRWRQFCKDEFESDHIAQLQVFQALKAMTSFYPERVGVDATAYRRAVELEHLLDRRMHLGERPEELSASLTAAMRKQILECVWSGMLDSLFRSIGTDGSNSYWKGVHSNGERKLSRGSVVTDAHMLVGRAFDLVVMGDTEDTRTIPLILMASAIDPDWVMKNSTPQLRRDVQESVNKVNRKLRPRKTPGDLYNGGKRFGDSDRRR